MGMKFTKIPDKTFEQIASNAGIIVDSFIPARGEIGNILCATTGGLTFNDNITYKDLGEGIDNAPTNTKELKQIEKREVSLSGTGVTVTNNFAKSLMAAADIDALDSTHVIPRNELEAGDFHDLWWIGDYSDKNGAENGGFVAIHLKDTLSTGGFQMKSTDKDKTQWPFTYTAHSSIYAQDAVPYDFYIREGEAESSGYRMDVLSEEGTSAGYTAVTVSESAGSGETYVYQTGSGLYVPGKGSVLTGSAWTAWNGSSEIESESGLDIVVAIIDSEKKTVHAGKAIVAVKES